MCFSAPLPSKKCLEEKGRGSHSSLWFESEVFLHYRFQQLCIDQRKGVALSDFLVPFKSFYGLELDTTKYKTFYGPTETLIDFYLYYIYYI